MLASIIDRCGEICEFERNPTELKKLHYFIISTLPFIGAKYFYF